jgi:hypothetical protein
MFGYNRKIAERDAEIAELTELVEKLTKQLIKIDKERCKLLGIDYDSL